MEIFKDARWNEAIDISFEFQFQKDTRHIFDEILLYHMSSLKTFNSNSIHSCRLAHPRLNPLLLVRYYLLLSAQTP